jgi:hypothetical protein
VHPYKKPRDDDEAEAVTPTKKKPQKAKPTFEQVMAKFKKTPRAYNIGEYFKELEVVSHPKFGTGYVTENIGNDKIEVTFQSEKRVLIHNRKGLNLPILGGLGSPVEAKGKKAKAAPAKAQKAPAAKPAPAARASTVRPTAKPARPAPRAAKPARPVRAAAKARPIRAAQKKKAAPKKAAPKKAAAKKAAKPAGKKKR